VPSHSPQLVLSSHNSPFVRPATREVQPQRVRVQPHKSSFFLPGHIAGKPAHFLLDSGCTTNILSRQFFDTLGVAIKRRLAPYEGSPGTLADGSCIPFCGIIELAGRVRDQNIQETFIVRQLNEDAILGMPFLQRHGCHIDFSKSVMVMGHKELTCVDKLGRSLAGGIQVVRSCTIPGHSWVPVHCKVDSGYSSGLGVVESMHGRIRPTHSFDRLTQWGEIWVQYINPFPESVNLLSGSALGQFYPVQEEDSGPSWETTTERPQQRPSAGRRATPNLAGMRDGHWAQGVGNRERRSKTKLLHRYSETPHQGDRGDSLNRAARREVPVVAGTALTQQTTRNKGRGSLQSKPDKQDSREAEHDQKRSQLQQRAGRPQEVVHYSRAELVWTAGLQELQHLQENSPGVVAEVYRARQEGQRPSDQQLRQGCTDLRLYCRRWDSLRIGPNGLLTMSVATTQELPTGEKISCLTAIHRKLVLDTHKQAHAEAQRVLAKLQLWWYWPYMESEIRRRVEEKCRKALARGGCQPGRKHVWGTTRRRGEA